MQEQLTSKHIDLEILCVKDKVQWKTEPSEICNGNEVNQVKEGREREMPEKAWDTTDLGDWKEIERQLELVQRISKFMSFLLGTCISTVLFSYWP